ncbi:MAG: hypothetical protein JO076_01670 [Verrucomicrobia bacterium]|nr:hypothetical protein [Verrucomicrobiota bacterium]
MEELQAPAIVAKDQVVVSGSASNFVSDTVHVTERDVVFNCSHCEGEIVIDKEGSGLAVHCPFCGSELIVPEYSGPSLRFLQTATAKLAREVEAARQAPPPTSYHLDRLSPEELKRRQTALEGAFQDTQVQASEIKEHVHHATIQLHRYQLKLEVILERQSEIKAELDAIREISRTLKDQESS